MLTKTFKVIQNNKHEVVVCLLTLFHLKKPLYGHNRIMGQTITDPKKNHLTITQYRLKIL